jgi:hypothetical protein
MVGESRGLRWQSAATTPFRTKPGFLKRRGATLPAAVQDASRSSNVSGKRASVLDCGGPPPLFSERLRTRTLLLEVFSAANSHCNHTDPCFPAKISRQGNERQRNKAKPCPRWIGPLARISAPLVFIPLPFIPLPFIPCASLIAAAPRRVDPCPSAVAATPPEIPAPWPASLRIPPRDRNRPRCRRRR